MRKTNIFDETRLNSGNTIDFAHLVPAAQNGGQQSMAAICEAFQPLALSLARREKFYYMRDDVPSIVYLSIVKNVLNYQGSTYDKFPGYIKKMVVFELNNYCSKLQTISNVEKVDIDIAPEAFLADENKEEENIDVLLVHDSLRQLPFNYHLIISYIYWQGWSEKQIAAQMGITQQAVNKMKKRALAMLKEVLEIK